MHGRAANLSVGYSLEGKWACPPATPLLPTISLTSSLAVFTPPPPPRRRRRCHHALTCAVDEADEAPRAPNLQQQQQRQT